MIPWKHKEKLPEARTLLQTVQKLLTGFNNGNLGIGQVSNKAQIAYDIHQTIRYHLGLERKPEHDMDINFDKPFYVGTEPPTKITPENK